MAVVAVVGVLMTMMVSSVGKPLVPVTVVISVDVEVKVSFQSSLWLSEQNFSITQNEAGNINHCRHIKAVVQLSPKVIKLSLACKVKAADILAIKKVFHILIYHQKKVPKLFYKSPSAWFPALLRGTEF